MTIQAEMTSAEAREEIFSEKAAKKRREEVMNLFQVLGGGEIGGDDAVREHDENYLVKPRGMSDAKAARLFADRATANDKVATISRTFRYRPWDGAVAVNRAMKEVYGIASMGKPIHSFFGTKPPEEIDVQVDIDTTTGDPIFVTVPTGLVDHPDFEGEMYIGEEVDSTYGPLFQLTVKCPRKYRVKVNGFFNYLEEYLKQNSIYRGKALVGAGSMDRHGNFSHPKFINPYAIDPNQVAYRDDVFQRLRSAVWGPIRTAKLQRMAGLKLNRKTLLFGPYGTGKSLGGGLTARTAVNNGWTFIQAKTGDENLNSVLRTAELYAPAVVFIEDADTLMDADPKKMSELLEQFDGVSSKDKEVMVLMTSNHVESLSKGMTRVGRIDAAIEIGDLDTHAVRRLISTAFEEVEPYNGHIDHGVYEAMSKELTAADLRMSDGSMLGDVDYEVVMEAMKGFEPAFIMGTLNLAKSNAIVRTESLNFKLNTEDFVLAADTLRNQHDTHKAASDRPTVDRFGEMFKSIIKEGNTETLGTHKVDLNGDGEIVAYAS